MTNSVPVDVRESPAIHWRRALPALLLTLFAILLLYRDTAMAMVKIWSTSDTFAHGFLVPPITVWLIWRIRHDVARLTPRPNYWVLLLLAGAGFAWLLGELATVGVVSQFALTTMLVLSVPAVLGLPVARSIAFPLAFLFFAVPFGEFALPQMMEWTAGFTVFALRLIGIPVFREGLQFVIPSGHWSVVEACSGVRYLIASFVVGTLFSYLTYQSAKRRIIFTLLSLLVPLLANWLRAFMIVMLGHLSGNKLAVGVDHLIYGWVFFGVVIMLMFWIGARWREDESLPTNTQTSFAVPRLARTYSSLPLAAMALLVIVLIWPMAKWQLDGNTLSEARQIEAIEPIPGWDEVEKFADWEPRFQNPSASLQSAYSAGEATVGVYIGYYRNQDYSRKMVSSVNVLVASNNPVWARVASGARWLELGNQSLAVRSAELRSSDNTRMIVWQWYWINGHLTSSDYAAKVYTILSRLTGQGDDSAVIFVYASKEQGEAVLDDFVRAADPVIERALNRTRDKR